MLKEIKNLWVKALLSGKYTQTKHKLSNKKSFCCLGGLCELAIKKGVEVNKDFFHSEDKLIAYDGNLNYLPDSVRIWAGMNSEKGEFGPEDTENLGYRNDSGSDFEKIASLINKHWRSM